MTARLKAGPDRIASKTWHHPFGSLPPSTLDLVVPVLRDRPFVIYIIVCHCVHVGRAVVLTVINGDYYYYYSSKPK